MTTEILLTIVVCALTWAVLRGGWRQGKRKLDLRPAGNAIGLGVLAVLAAVYFWGPMAGLALIVSVMVHEFGHVAAFRVAGHPDATFRLIPMFGGVAISAKAPKSDLHQLYISIMGPGICLALMFVSYALYESLYDVSILVGSFFWYVAIITGMLNFGNLLPLYPLDGGQIVRILTQTYSPKLAYYLTISMCVLLLGFSVYNRMLFISVFAVLALQNAMGMPKYRTRHGLSAGQMATGAAAYILMLIAFGVGGWPFISNYF